MFVSICWWAWWPLRSCITNTWNHTWLRSLLFLRSLLSFLFFSLFFSFLYVSFFKFFFSIFEITVNCLLHGSDDAALQVFDLKKIFSPWNMTAIFRPLNFGRQFAIWKEIWNMFAFSLCSFFPSLPPSLPPSLSLSLSYFNFFFIVSPCEGWRRRKFEFDGESHGASCSISPPMCHSKTRGRRKHSKLSLSLPLSPLSLSLPLSLFLYYSHSLVRS